MSRPDDVAAGLLGLHRPPAWADPVSRQRGHLQYEVRELERRERLTKRELSGIQVRLQACRAALQELSEQGGDLPAQGRAASENAPGGAARPATLETVG